MITFELVEAILYDYSSEIYDDFILSKIVSGTWRYLLQEIVQDDIFSILQEATIEVEAETWFSELISTSIREYIYKLSPEASSNINSVSYQVMFEEA